MEVTIKSEIIKSERKKYFFTLLVISLDCKLGEAYNLFLVVNVITTINATTHLVT